LLDVGLLKAVFKVRGQGLSFPCSGLSPSPVNGKVFFYVENVPQIPHPIDASVPSVTLLDLATLTTD